MNQGCFIKQRREELGLSRYAVHHAAGVSDSHMKRVERGESRIIDPEKIAALADAIQTTPDELYRHAGLLAPDLVAWLITRPRLIRELRTHMERTPRNGLVSAEEDR